jgi:hypothetical protein
MDRFTLPPVAFGDGLGWNSDFLWMCANDDCPIFRKGFEQAFAMYGRTVSMRAIVEPDTGRHSVTPAFTFDPGHIQTFLAARDENASSAQRGRCNDEDGDCPDEKDYDIKQKI